MILKSVYPPVCVHGVSSNKWYVITDGSWQEVDRQYSWSELEKFWQKITLQRVEKPEKKKPYRQYKVIGSKGNTYTVTDNRGYWHCTCPSAMYHRGDCKHIKQLKEKP